MRSTINSYNTKLLISNNFKKIVKNKPFTKVTVAEIVRESDINRKTFYYHFEDINDLLRWTLDQDAIEIVKNFDLIKNYDDAIKFGIEYIERNKSFLKNIYFSVGEAELKRFLSNDFYEVIRVLINDTLKELNSSMDNKYKEFLVRFYTGALADGIIDIITDDKLDKDLFSKYIKATIRTSLLAITNEYKEKRSHYFDI